MTLFIIRRLLQSVVVMLIMSILVFLAVYTIGNPVDVLIDPRASQAEIERAMKALGLDQTLWQQYLVFLQNILQGDFGKSWVYSEPALSIMLQRLPATLELAAAAVLLANLIGIPLGLYAGYQPAHKISRCIMGTSLVGLSVPAFWVGIMFIYLFGVELHWLPILGRGDTVDVLGVPLSFLTLDGLAHLFLPALTLALNRIAMIIRLVRAGVQEVLMQDYIKFAHAKGLRAKRIALVHVLKNVLIPVITVVGMDFAGLLAFAVVTETVFSWPGMGKLIIDSIAMLDRPMIIAYLMVTVLMFILINLLVDLIYGVVDPRVSFKAAQT